MIYFMYTTTMEGAVAAWLVQTEQSRLQPWLGT